MRTILNLTFDPQRCADLAATIADRITAAPHGQPIDQKESLLIAATLEQIATHLSNLSPTQAGHKQGRTPTFYNVRDTLSYRLGETFRHPEVTKAPVNRAAAVDSLATMIGEIVARAPTTNERIALQAEAIAKINETTLLHLEIAKDRNGRSSTSFLAGIAANDGVKA